MAIFSRYLATKEKLMSDWKVISKQRDLGTDLAVNIASLGVSGLLGEKTYVYVVEHEETGETKTIKASDKYELGDRISEGDFEE